MKKENILFLGEELCYSIRKANQWQIILESTYTEHLYPENKCLTMTGLSRISNNSPTLWSAKSYKHFHLS